jgi:phosphatidylglycerol:prolipoprotein diacylglycerol transferase
MHPTLFDFGPFTLYTYGVLLAAAYLIGLRFALVRARSRALDPHRVMDLGIWIIVSALVGAKLMLLVTDFHQYTRNPRALVDLARSAGVFYGGLLAALAVAFVYIRRHRMPLWTTTDVFAPGLALGHAVGRLGCLMAGCCFGRPTTVAWAITFHDPAASINSDTPLGVPLHPTQLYEAGAELLILGVLLWLERRGHAFAGRTFWTYILLYGVARFVIEFYRGDPRGSIGILSTSQFVSLIAVPIAVVMLAWLSRRGNPEGYAVARRVAA